MSVCSYTTATFGELALNAGGGYELVDINSRLTPPCARLAASPRSSHATTGLWAVLDAVCSGRPASGAG